MDKPKKTFWYVAIFTIMVAAILNFYLPSFFGQSQQQEDVPEWGHTPITVYLSLYDLSNSSPMLNKSYSLSEPLLESALTNAMKYWEKSSTKWGGNKRPEYVVKFERVDDIRDADIVVTYVDDLQGRGEFDGSGGVAEVDIEGNKIVHAEIMVERVDVGILTPLYERRVLRMVLVHEMGHALGLKDVDKMGDVMNPKTVERVLPNRQYAYIILMVFAGTSVGVIYFVIRQYRRYLQAREQRAKLEKEIGLDRNDNNDE
ncbi:MAG: matrixin family metalloprotease [Methermicoccaceae archaeon]